MDRAEFLANVTRYLDKDFNTDGPAGNTAAFCLINAAIDRAGGVDLLADSESDDPMLIAEIAANVFSRLGSYVLSEKSAAVVTRDRIAQYVVLGLVTERSAGILLSMMAN